MAFWPHVFFSGLKKNEKGKGHKFENCFSSQQFYSLDTVCQYKLFLSFLDTQTHLIGKACLLPQISYIVMLWCGSTFPKF